MAAHTFPKSWSRAFALEPTKLIRMHEILLERLQRAGGKPTFRYSTKQKNGPSLDHPTLEAVTSLDHTRRQPIEALRLIGSRAGPGPELKCEIIFNGSLQNNIKLTTVGDDSVEVSETVAAIEEQIERTFTARLAPVLSLAGGILILGFALMWLERFDPYPIFRAGPPRDELIALDQKASTIRSTSEQIEFLFEVERRQVHAEAVRLAPADLSQALTLSNILNGIVILIAAGLLIYLGLGCYPRAVFVWGDGGKRYELLCARRFTIRNIFFGVIIGGIVINLVSSALWDRYKGAETHPSDTRPASNLPK